jgi:hypothetical protein
MRTLVVRLAKFQIKIECFCGVGIYHCPNTPGRGNVGQARRYVMGRCAEGGGVQYLRRLMRLGIRHAGETPALPGRRHVVCIFWCGWFALVGAALGLHPMRKQMRMVGQALPRESRCRIITQPAGREDACVVVAPVSGGTPVDLYLDALVGE